MKLIFGTGNAGKLSEAQAILIDCEIVGTQIEVDEIQSLDKEKVALRKAKDYFVQLNVPLFIEDVALSFDAMSGLPGTYIDSFMKSLGNPGIIDLMKEKDNRKAVATTTLVYIDEKGEPHIFKADMNGSVANEERGTNGFGWDTIFIPEGQDKTLAEMTLEEKNQYSMRAVALKELKKWLDAN